MGCLCKDLDKPDSSNVLSTRWSVSSQEFASPTKIDDSS